MGSSQSSRARSDHIVYDKCRKDCWKNTILPELEKLHINSGLLLKSYLKGNGDSLEIQCPNCISIKINIYKDIDPKLKCKLKKGTTKCKTGLDIDDEFKVVVTDAKTNIVLKTYTTESTTQVYNIIKAIYGN